MKHELGATMLEVRIIASGLRFPEGPVALQDGSVLVVEIERGTLTRVLPTGETHVVANLGGGPNGAAIGPDGRCYVCNSGGFMFHEIDGATLPGLTPADYTGGWIEAVDLETGVREVLYRNCGNNSLRGPNDIVFDEHGGFWFTDTGKVTARQRDRGAVYYARTDGSMIRQVIFPLDGPNGIGLSPDNRTLYVSETWTGRVWSYEVTGPGEIRKTVGGVPWERGSLLVGLGGYSVLDSMAIDIEGNVCVADIPYGGITVISPSGEVIERHPLPDRFATNICFGGPGLRTAYITLSSTGKLASVNWPRAGLPLHWLNRTEHPVAECDQIDHPSGSRAS
ncbi:gluconolactonase [Paraburkholderia unamae]|uniref:SMP-30/gluconolactonase/LRE family protein n=1 Tax=Paraburkholderia unamae TaxID=219649 RepID=UPI000DC44D51|nr:SMP-30/gluconolactonase/LRE family protein [Paraburkholderia unamae]RAR54545.1 gluconolactonase [Paraburkholderia unamae]